MTYIDLLKAFCLVLVLIAATMLAGPWVVKCYERYIDWVMER